MIQFASRGLFDEEVTSAIYLHVFFWGGGGQRPLVPLLLLGPPFFVRLFFLGSTTLLTGMTGISLHMQLPLTS
jgi:hypothetical protein